MGIYSFSASYYNKSESLLNKNLTGFLIEASKRRIYTRISSNLSFQKLDVDAFVLSGLNLLDVSVDGATQTTYEKYRRGGNIEWVFDNVRKLVAAKKRLSSKTPFIRRKYWTFEHNVHEAEDALQIAEDLEVDEIQYSMPYPGPTTAPAPHPKFTPDGKLTAHRLNSRPEDSWVFASENNDLADTVDGALSESWLQRYERLSVEHGADFDEQKPGQDLL